MQVRQALLCVVALSALAAGAAPAEELPTPPEALVRSVANDLLQSIKSDPRFQGGNVARLQELVDEQVMPHVDMHRLTSIAMGRYWRQASPEQQRRLATEFKALLVRSYAGALSQVSARQSIELRPRRAANSDAEVVVPTLIRGSGEPIPIDYRLHRGDADWQIYDVAIAGIWLAENYRNTFAQEVGASGIDGLIEKLHARNAAAAGAAGSK